MPCVSRRVGLPGPAAATPSSAGGRGLGRPRTESGERGACSSRATENLVELAGVVDAHLTEEGLPTLIFGVASVESTVTAAVEGVFRESVGQATLDEVLAEGRSAFEAAVGRRLIDRLQAEKLPVAIDRVRVVDAHPPREVVPAYRDVAAAVSDSVRYTNQAEAYAAETRLGAAAEAQARKDLARAEAVSRTRRAEGERQAYLALASARRANPSLTDFGLLWNTFAAAYADRPKLILDPRAAGRRHLWLTDPPGPGRAEVVEPNPTPLPLVEPPDE
ncbi:MAG: SPFH domain-containing protein [Isosphaeraceae bacterium]